MPDTERGVSTIGLKNVVLAPVTKDDDEGTTYGTLIPVPGAIEATISPENQDPDIQYADDIEYSVTYLDPKISMTTTMAGLPLAVQEKILGNEIDENGVLIRSATDDPPYFAMGFKSEKADHTFRYVWLYKVRAKPIAEKYATKEGDTMNRQTMEVEWTAIKRTSDQKYQAVADEGQNGFDGVKAAAFLKTVYGTT